MPSLSLTLRILVAIGATAFPAGVQAEPNTTTLNYSVMRNGDQIGATTVRLVRNGAETVADVATHIQVKIAFLTVYSFDQRETERWMDGRLVALNSVTDNNGTVHKVSAKNRGSTLSVDADGHVSTVDSAVMPVSLWNPSLLGKTLALDPQSGKLTPVSVVDHGEERLVLQGRETAAHHYSIRTGFAQDVWYDRNRRLIKVELHAVDGSKIQYRLG